MSTTKSRLNISLPNDIKKALLSIAKRDQMPAATKALRLMEIGLELEEDDVWDKIASNRDRKDSVFRTHTEVFEK
jgi:mRNA interferase RelE/StbE